MGRRTTWAAVGLLAASPLAIADEVEPAGGLRRAKPAPAAPCPPVVVAPLYPGMPAVTVPDGTTPPVTPTAPPLLGETQPPTVPAPGSGALGQTAEGGGQSLASYNQNFWGDNVGVFYTRPAQGFATTTRVVGFTPRQVGTTERLIVNDRGEKVVVQVPNIVQDPILRTERTPVGGVVRVPLPGRYQGIRITENDSARPTDRVYFGYNYYDDINGSLNPPGVRASNLNRQTVGFEKTFLGGDASVGMRLPFVQLDGPAEDREVGDLTVLTKFAWVNDRRTGDVLSTGFIITVPTGGGGAILLDGTEAPHSTLLQPWAGFVKNYGDLYMQGLSSLVIPTDDRDPTVWFNSISVGYWLYRNDGDRFLTGIVPATELHINTPLSNRSVNDLIFVQDQVNLTSGVHFVLPRATLGGAVCVPLAGPRPWNVEALMTLNVRF